VVRALARHALPIDGLIQADDEAHEAVCGEIFESSAQDRRDLGLVDAEFFGGFLLRQAMGFDEASDLLGETGLGQAHFRVQQAEVLKDKDIAGAVVDYRIIFCGFGPFAGFVGLHGVRCV
jgi:hypothetical protein